MCRALNTDLEFIPYCQVLVAWYFHSGFTLKQAWGAGGWGA